MHPELLMLAQPPVKFHFWVFPALFATGLVAGFVDSIAGGGGLITLPVVLSLGVPPQLALGINKLQATFGSGSAAWHYRRSGIVRLRDCWVGIYATILGAIAGTLVVQHLDPSFLKRIIPFALLAVVAYMIFRPQIGEKDIHPNIRPFPFFVLAGILLGFYDGFLGPGTGSFWTMALMLGPGFNLTKATGYTKVMNFASNLTSLTCFILVGQVEYTAGLTMGFGQLIGAKIGSGLVVSKGTKFIRPVFITMVLAVIIKLLYSAYFS